jgi:hypothetical protein
MNIQKFSNKILHNNGNVTRVHYLETSKTLQVIQSQTGAPKECG